MRLRGWAGVLLPGHSVSTDLQELEDVLGFFPVLGFLFGCQCVVGHEQGMVSTS